MISWSQLPLEIKRHVVQKLDFMSRVSLKNTCHLDRQIVESTKLYVPRARFGYKDGKCLVMIYTGIEKFLRLEMEKCGNGVVIYKSENSYDHSKFAKKFIPSSEPFYLGLFILKSLLIDKSINIGVIEWDLPEEPGEEMIERIMIFFWPTQFQVKEMVCLWNSTECFLPFCAGIVVWEQLKSIRRLGVFPSSGSFQPIFVHEDELEYKEKPYYKTSMTMSYSPELFGFAFVFSFYQQKSICANYRLKNGIAAESKPFHRKEENDTVTRCYASECGTWEHKMLKENENQLKDRLDSQKCGTSWLCEKHADPFDYWYHQNFPLRLAQEPHWNAVICIGSEFSMGLDHLFNPMIEAAKEAEKKRLENMIEDTSTSSWGFRRLAEGEIRNVPDDIEKKKGDSESGKPKGNNFSQMNMDDIIKCLVEAGAFENQQSVSEESEDLKDSEDVEDPDDADESGDLEVSKCSNEIVKQAETDEDSEDVLCPKESLLKKFQVFSIILLIPIVVSFVLYLFFVSL